MPGGSSRAGPPSLIARRSPPNAPDKPFRPLPCPTGVAPIAHLRLRAPMRAFTTRLLRIEGLNMDKVKRLPYVAVE